MWYGFCSFMQLCAATRINQIGIAMAAYAALLKSLLKRAAAVLSYTKGMRRIKMEAWWRA
jgi:hypothetical protein